MKNQAITAAIFAFTLLTVFSGCTKEAVQNNATEQLAQQNLNADQTAAKQGVYKTYTIAKGNHFCNNNTYPPFFKNALYFTVIFDSSAIYHFTDPNTLYDQNTLYGFADNNKKHEQFSARFGWRWFNNALQLAAYTNNYGDSTITEIGNVPLNSPINCGIVINGNMYDFYLNDSLAISLPRASTTSKAGPYKLLPYFGGDATAPHKVTIKIKEN